MRGSPVRVLKGRGVREGWTFFKEEVLKAQEQAVPMCCKTKLSGKMTGLAEHGALAGTQGKKRRICHLWKKGQATQEYRGCAERKLER